MKENTIEHNRIIKLSVKFKFKKEKKIKVKFNKTKKYLF